MENQTSNNAAVGDIKEHVENLNELTISYFETEDGLTEEQRTSIADTYRTCKMLLMEQRSSQ